MGETFLAVGIVAVLVSTIGFVSFFRQRPGPRQVSETPLAGQPLSPESTGDELDVAITLAPVPNNRNEALAIGSEAAVAALEQSGLVARAGTQGPGTMAKLLRTGTALLGTGSIVETDRKIQSGHLVEMTDKSFKELQKFGPTLDKAGNPLGIIRNEKSINSIVRFKPAAGVNPMVMSNAATLAMTIAVSQQLGNIEEKLGEIQETLDQLLADTDRRRIAQAVAANQELIDIAKDVSRRGEMTEADMNRLASLSLPVRTGQVEAEMSLIDLIEASNEALNRDERRKRVAELLDKKRLEYWLSVRVQAELALTRQDLLRLYWEMANHPASAKTLCVEVRTSIEGRQERLARVGQILRELTDPEARTRLDPLRFLDARDLGKKQTRINQILDRHSEAFAGPGFDRFAVSEEGLEPVVLQIETCTSN
jgi:hypothetical protein